MHPRESDVVSSYVPSLKPCPRIPTDTSARLPIPSPPSGALGMADGAPRQTLGGETQTCTRQVDGPRFAMSFASCSVASSANLSRSIPGQPIGTTFRGEEPCYTVVHPGGASGAVAHTQTQPHHRHHRHPVSHTMTYLTAGIRRSCTLLSPLTPSHKHNSHNQSCARPNRLRVTTPNPKKPTNQSTNPPRHDQRKRPRHFPVSATSHLG